MKNEITLRDAQQLVDAWIKKHGVRYFSELTNVAVLMEEVGEVARLAARQFGDQSFKKKESFAAWSDELADILFVLLCLANQTNVDLTHALKKNMHKKITRDSARHRRNKKLK